VVHISWQGTPEVLIVAHNGTEEKLDSSEKEDSTLSLTVPEVLRVTPLKITMRHLWRRVGTWRFEVLPDQPPRISLTEEPDITVRKTLRVAYEASDDYGLESIIAHISPVEPQEGVSAEPVEIPVSQPAMKQVRMASYIDLTHLPWAGTSVAVQLIATDGAGHKGWSAPKTLTLPTRKFGNPFARALIEERKKLLHQPDAATRDEAANVMAGIARQQNLYRGDKVVMMALRSGAVRLVLGQSAEAVMPVSALLWQTALRLEEGEIGLARADLAEAQRDLSMALMRGQTQNNILSFWREMEDAMARYLDILEAERARQPPALQELDWPLATAQEMLAPEDLKNKLAGMADLLKSGNTIKAREQLAQLQILIENLRTTPPDLTPEQAFLAQQVSTLRALVRNQKTLNEDMGRLLDDDEATTQSRRGAAAHALAQQQLLIAALKDVIEQAHLSLPEAQSAQEAMRSAVLALQKRNLEPAQQKQAEALALLQNALLALSDQMKRSLTAKAP
jgi:hypothetical protein